MRRNAEEATGDARLDDGPSHEDAIADDPGFGVAYKLLGVFALSLLFFIVVVPLGVAIRALGRDRLRLRRDAAAESYWTLRARPGPAAASMTKQL